MSKKNVSETAIEEFINDDYNIVESSDELTLDFGVMAEHVDLYVPPLDRQKLCFQHIRLVDYALLNSAFGQSGLGKAHINHSDQTHTLFLSESDMTLLDKVGYKGQAPIVFTYIPLATKGVRLAPYLEEYLLQAGNPHIDELRKERQTSV